MEMTIRDTHCSLFTYKYPLCSLFICIEEKKGEEKEGCSLLAKFPIGDLIQITIGQQEKYVDN